MRTAAKRRCSRFVRRRKVIFRCRKVKPAMTPLSGALLTAALISPRPLFIAAIFTLPPITAFSAAPVAADGKIYCSSEDGVVYVIKAGPKLEVLAKNDLGEPCLATPAISQGVVYFRTSGSLMAIG